MRFPSFFSVIGTDRTPCIFTSCTVDVIQPTLRWTLLTLPLDALIAVNLVMQYYFACTTRPGFVDVPPAVAGEGLLWARVRQRRGITSRVGNGGVRWSDAQALNITKARVTQCRKCKQTRPEVGWFSLFEALGLTLKYCPGESSPLSNMQPMRSEV